MFKCSCTMFVYKYWLFSLVIVICATENLTTSDSQHEHTKRSPSIKKELAVQTAIKKPIEPVEDSKNNSQHNNDISGAPIKKNANQSLLQETINQDAVFEDPTKNYQHVKNFSDINTDDYKTVFFGFLGLSFAALMFFVYKSYKLRSSRAERKYGVQGDRTTQELTPLPVALEDVNSDEDDQTIFELNKQQIVL